MDVMRKNAQISNSYYNLGLEKARIRDLTGAAESLKRSLHFNKYQEDARNLLGLIYYEMGEVADALVQWVISLNLSDKNNQAAYYLKQIQGNERHLEAVSQTIKKYNQALIHAQSGSDDLAVLQLMRAVEMNRNYVKAHLLLAALYILHEEYTKAGKSLYRVLQIDKNNPKALVYMSIVKENTGRAEIEKRKLKNAFSHRQMQDDDIIIPPSYKENTGWQTVLNIVVGLALGAAVIFFLVVPTIRKNINNVHNQEMLEYSELLNQKNLEIDRLTAAAEEAEAAQLTAESTLAELVGSSDGVLRQYQILAQILQAYRDEDMLQAAQLYVTWNREALMDGQVDDIVTQIAADMQENGAGILKTAADEAYNAGNRETALDYYQQSLLINAENPEVLYQIGLIYKAMEDTDTANEYFSQVIMNYPDSEYVEQAQTERGY